MSAYGYVIGRDVLLILLICAAVLAGAWIERTLPRRFRTRRWPVPVRKASLRRLPDPKPFDAAEQLRIVERASFSARSVVNAGEARLWRIVEQACIERGDGWRALAQVSLGEILSSPDPEAYRAINSKRVDILLIDAAGRALHAIELQGTGHHLGAAATRDAIKKEALRRAGIGYVEVVPGDTPAEVRSLIDKLSRRAAHPPIPA